MATNTDQPTNELEVHQIFEEDEISLLKENILKKIQQNKNHELLPYYGLLFFKDVIWHGNVFEIRPKTHGDICSGDQNAEMTPTTHYVLQINPMIIKEMEGESTSLKNCWTIFDLVGGADSDRSPELGSRLLNSTTLFIKDTSEKQRADKENISYILSVRDIELDRNEQSHMKVCNGVTIGNSLSYEYLTVLTDATSSKFASASSHVDGYEIRPMTITEALFATKQWEYYTSDNPIPLFLFTACANEGLSMGAFPHGSDTPVSWAFISWHGAINVLQTLPEHRRKGLAQAVVKKLSLMLIEKSLISYAFIAETNIASMKFFSSLGFDILKGSHFDYTFAKF